MQQALLIVDMQNDYFPDGSMPLVNIENAAANAKSLLERFRADNLPVIHVQHISNRSGATFFLPETSGAEICSALRPLPGETVVIKHYPNSFRETGLADLLTQQHIKHLVVCGAMSHMCIDTTVRAAFDLGFLCTLAADACATRDLHFMDTPVPAAQVHNAFMAALNGLFARVMTADDYLTTKHRGR
ncbi:MAG TPA: cysteine hydrolase family protein [bacterium]|nr:cysteine hydrolase family protein [bacterium]HPN45998.1 cysteine hydrolase family protein [bacterium]